VGTAAPDESSTVPLMVPRSTCASRGANVVSVIERTSQILTAEIDMEHLPQPEFLPD
jgi:hypothetical protein